MGSKRYARGNIHRDDFYRAVVTDSLPAEVPIIFSNDGFYQNLKAIDSLSCDTRALVDPIVFGDKSRFTIPYRYRVTK